MLNSKPESCVLLDSEETLFQLLLLLRLYQTPVPQPSPPLLRVQGEQDHQVGLKQVTRPAIHLRTLYREVAHWAADCCGNGVRCRAVPEPGGRQQQ